MSKKFIVKVQISLFSSDDQKLVMIYDEGRTFTDQFPATKELLDGMGGEPKKFFWAKTADDGFLELGEEAEWQEW